MVLVLAGLVLVVLVLVVLVLVALVLVVLVALVLVVPLATPLEQHACSSPVNVIARAL